MLSRVIVAVALVLCALIGPANAEEKDRRHAVDTQAGNDKWTFGREIKFDFEGFEACVIVPKGRVDRSRRWIWDAPGYLVMRGKQGVEHTFYVEMLLAKGFHVVGLETGPTLGSPAGAEIYHRFYKAITKQYHLNQKARLVAQSNGGLLLFAWAFRHPECVDRIFGIMPVLDFRTWPGLDWVVDPSPIDKIIGIGAITPKELGYKLTRSELERRIAEFNPIDNLKPMADAGIRIFLIHGDEDGTVPIGPNSEELVRRYRAFGGQVELQVAHGFGHTTPLPVYYESERALRFLIE